MAVRNNFQPGEVLLSADMNDTFGSKLDISDSGLQLVATANLSGSATSLTGILSSDFRNYRIVMELAPSTTATLTMRLRLSVNNTDNVYTTQTLDTDNTTITRARTLATSWDLGSVTGFSSFSLDLFGPQLARKTQFTSIGSTLEGSQILRIASGSHDNSVSYTGVSFILSTGTFNAGSVEVYGYGN